MMPFPYNYVKDPDIMVTNSLIHILHGLTYLQVFNFTLREMHLKTWNDARCMSPNEVRESHNIDV